MLAVFCLCCYLFKNDVGKQGGGDAFVKEGFDAWNKSDRFDKHVGVLTVLIIKHGENVKT